MVQTEQPKKRCSKCGSLENHLVSSPTFEIMTGGTVSKTWIECLKCKHRKLHSTFTTNTFINEPYQVISIPKQDDPKFDNF